MKKKLIWLAAGILSAALAGCGAAGQTDAGDSAGPVGGTGAGTDAGTGTDGEDAGLTQETAYHKMTVDEKTTYQTMESFGTSGAWWSQYVGTFTKDVNDSGRGTREDIAILLFDREEGIGLTSYRYNMGAGSADSRQGTFWDTHRRAHSFLDEEGNYDFTKDAGAVWFLEKAAQLGVEEVVLFSNSPPVWLTDNGLAHMTEGGSRVNIQPEKYPEFAAYCMDVAEHFVQQGIPVKFISPINEPQWDWYNGQEGCHYEPKQITNLYLAFLDELENRPALEGVKLSGPESGEWGTALTQQYVLALLGNERLAAHFDGIDNHSYWSDDTAKRSFRNWMTVHYPDVKLRTSEWCEMVNGSDVTMDSAFHLAQEIAADIRILQVVSWQNWVAVAPGGYRDGLIYIDEASQKFRPLKRLWSFGNYSRYVRPGYVRVEIAADTDAQEKMLPTAFTGVNDRGERELVMVFINESETPQEFVLEGISDYSRIAVYETSDEHDLACVREDAFDPAAPVEIAKMSVTTVVLTGQ